VPPVVSLGVGETDDVAEVAEEIDITTRVVGAGLLELPDRRMIRRMPRLQVYLPDALYRAVKERQLPASELLQSAVRAELRRQELLEETDRYLSELIEEVGEPSPASVAKAERLAGRVRGEKTRASKAS